MAPVRLLRSRVPPRPCRKTSSGRRSPERRPAGTTATERWPSTTKRSTRAPWRSTPPAPTTMPAAAAAAATKPSTPTRLRGKVRAAVPSAVAVRVRAVLGVVVGQAPSPAVAPGALDLVVGPAQARDHPAGPAAGGAGRQLGGGLVGLVGGHPRRSVEAGLP